jgi:hypothetical protein
MSDLRTRIAWLLWCANQGYILAEDRALVDNIFEADPTTLHSDDQRDVPGWLDMADAVIRELERSDCGGDLCKCSQCRITRLLKADDE